MFSRPRVHGRHMTCWKVDLGVLGVPAAVGSALRANSFNHFHPRLCGPKNGRLCKFNLSGFTVLPGPDDASGENAKGRWLCAEPHRPESAVVVLVASFPPALL